MVVNIIASVYDIFTSQVEPRIKSFQEFNKQCLPILHICWRRQLDGFFLLDIININAYIGILCSRFWIGDVLDMSISRDGFTIERYLEEWHVSIVKTRKTQIFVVWGNDKRRSFTKDFLWKKKQVGS